MDVPPHQHVNDAVPAKWPPEPSKLPFSIWPDAAGGDVCVPERPQWIPTKCNLKILCKDWKIVQLIQSDPSDQQPNPRIIIKLILVKSCWLCVKPNISVIRIISRGRWLCAVRREYTYVFVLPGLRSIFHEWTVFNTAERRRSRLGPSHIRAPPRPAEGRSSSLALPLWKTFIKLQIFPF